MQENEAAMNVQGNALGLKLGLEPEYLPLTSTAINSITFPGCSDKKDECLRLKASESKP